MSTPLLQPPVPVQRLDLRVGLAAVREAVRAVGTAAGLPPARVEEVVLAVHEVATNALTHGRGQGTIRIWSAGDELLCEIEDRGPGIADRDAGAHPPDPENVRGRGLWIARRLCELVEIEHAGPGARVRLRVRLARPT